MKLIDKYLFREYLVSLLCCAGGLALLFLVVGLFEKASHFLEAGMPLGQMLLFYGHYLLSYADRENVSTLARILPASVLAASLYSLSRLTKHNELTAMRASGVGLHRLMYPFLCVGLACSLVATLVQEGVSPRSSRLVDALEQKWRRGTTSKERIVRDIKHRGRHRTWQIRNLDLAEPTVLHGVTVKIERADEPTYLAKIIAERAEWRDGFWWFYDSRIRRYGRDEKPLGPWQGPEPEPVKMWQISETPQDIVAGIETDSETEDRYSTSFGVLRNLREREDAKADGYASRRVDAHGRIAIPWSCLVAALVSIPAGTRGGRKGAIAGVMLGVMLFFMYYWSIYLGAFLGKKQILAPWLSAWLPNIFFFFGGTVMIARMK
jgi:lipopolysaccharide export system permease protein